jgi:hypothetical protein
MSLSINDLLKGITDSNKKIQPKDSTLYNPDIPTQYEGGLDDEIEIKDQFASVMRIGGAYNGEGLPLAESGQLSMMDPRKVDFLFDGAIDPNIIRSRTDPDGSLPARNARSKFSLMPESVEQPHNQVPLIQKSRQSYINYQNRFNSAQQKEEHPQPRSGNEIRPVNHTEIGKDRYNFFMEEKPDDQPPAYTTPDGEITKFSHTSAVETSVY